MNNALLSTMTIVPTYDQSHLLQSTIDALPELPLLFDSASCRYYVDGWTTQTYGNNAPNPDNPIPFVNTYSSGNYKFEVSGAWYKLTLSDDLRSVDGIADRLWIEPRTGKAWVEKHVNVKNLVGTEVWVADTIASDTTKRYRLDGFNGWTDTSVCSHFSRIAADDDTVGYYGSEKSLYLKTDFVSVGALKDFLLSKSGAGSSVTVLYELEKAVLCPVSISEIAVTEGSTIELEGTVNSCAEDFVLYGKTYQVETTGAQLFDASKLLTHSQGGATVTNNGDGSFTVSGNGTLTSGFSHAIYLENEDVRRLFRPGEIYMAESPTATRPYFEVGFFKNDQNVCDIRPVSAFLKATLPDDFFAPENNLRVRYIFYGAPGLDIIPGTIKPMMYQDGDGTWEPYSESFPSPSPEYPQDIQGIGVRTKNLLNEKRMLDFILQKPGASIVQFDGRRCLKLDGAFNFPDFNLYEGFEPDKRYTLTFDGFYEKYKTEAHLSNGFAFTLQNGGRNLSLMDVSDIGTWKHKTTTSDTGVTKLTFTYGVSSVVYIDLDTIQLEEGTISTSYEPYGYMTDVVTRSKNLLDRQRMLDFILQKSGVSIVQFDGRRCLKLDGRFNYPDFILYEAFEPDKRYTLTYEGFYEKYYTSTGSSNGFAFDYQEGTLYALMQVSDIGTWKRRVTTTSTSVKNLYFSYGTAGVVYIDLYTIQLEEGTVSTPYQPYGCYTTPIYSKSPVYESDKIEYRNNEYGLVRKNGLLTDNGSMAWTKYTGGGSWGVQRCFRTIVPDMINYLDSVVAANAKLDLLCNRLPSGVFVGRDKPVSVGYSEGQRIYIRLDDEKYAGIDTVDQFKAWLAEHPVEILYPLDQEVWEPLSSISQQALKDLKTFQNYTYIICQDRLHPEIEAKTKNLNRNLPLLYDTISNTTLKLKTKPGRIKNFKLSGVTRQVETTGVNLFGGKALTDKIMELAPTAVLDTANKTITYAASAIVEKVLFTGFEPGKQYTVILYGSNKNPGVNSSNLRMKYTDGAYSQSLLFQGEHCIFTTDAVKTVETLEGVWDSQITTLHYDKCGIFEGVIALEAFEPYTGTQSSPSPEYPQDIQGVGKRTKNLFDKDAWYDFFYSKKQDIYWVDDDQTILRWRGSSGHDNINNRAFELPFVKVPENTWISLSFDGRKTVASESNETGMCIAENDNTASRVIATIGTQDGTDWVHKFACAKVSGNLTLTVTYNHNEYCEFKNIQIELSDHETPYEPYGYRTDVEVRSKNLADISGAKPRAGNTVYDKILNGFILDAVDNDRRIALIPCTLKKGVEYTYRFRRKYNMTGYEVYVYLPEITQYLTPNKDGDMLTCTFTPEADVTLFSIYFFVEYIGSGVEAEITELQVEEGNTSTPYQPYAYYTAPIYTREPLTQWDHIEYRNREYGVVKKSAVVVEDGSRNVDDTHYPILFFSTLAKPMNVDAKVYCNYCSSERIGRLSILGKNICINSADTYWGFANAPECKAWLTQKNAEGKPLYYCYETAEESWEPLPTISQQALRNLPTYKGTTIIDTTDPLEPEITVSYRPQTDYSKLLGLEADYEKGIFTRLGAAKNLTAGAQFNRFPIYAGRRRCNVLDDGTITAYYGDPDYKEDGSNGQVMVYQPKFYYQVVPLKIEPQTDGIGYHLRRAQYWVSPKPQPGFKLHPAFINASGQEVDHILLSAYESSLYDTSAATYILDDAQVMDVEADKLCSISGARPASGSKQNFTRTAIEQLAQNRGPGWHGDLIKPVSAEQLLMIIEMGMMNLQTAIAQGVVSLPYAVGDDTTSSYAAATGSTSAIGNGTGRAETTTTYEGGVAKEYTVDGKTSVCWRGKENFWGNIYNLVYGINIWGNGKMRGGQPYICNDFNFAESKNNGNYEGAGFTVTNTNGYISAMGYSTKYDWLFIASETLGNSSLPVSDYMYVTPDLNAYRITPLGGYWNGGIGAGAFFWSLNSGVGYRNRGIGGRLIYVPTDNLFNINRVFANPVPVTTKYYKYDLGLSPGNYVWSLQKNEFLGSDQHVLFTNDLAYNGGDIISGKIYRWIGHSSSEKLCNLSGSFTVTNVMYIACSKPEIEPVKPLLKTLRIEKA